MECVALQHKLAVLGRFGTRRPRFRPIDRLFWVVTSWWWPAWRDALVVASDERSTHLDPSPHHQYLLPYQPNGDCRATRNAGGGARFFAILRSRCGFACCFFGSFDCRLFGSDGCSCANASRVLGGTPATIADALMLSSALVGCEGVIVRTLVSKTTRAGHLSSE